MRINNRCLRIFLFSLPLLGAMLVLCPENTPAEPADIPKLDEAVRQQKKKIEKVQTGIASHQTKISASKKKERNLLDELEKIDRQIADESARLAALQEEMARQNEMTFARQKEMEQILLEKETLRHHMENRLAAYYRMGDIGAMNVFFSSASLAELLSLRENFLLMLKYDQQLITAFKKKMAELDEARQAHEQEKNRLLQAAAEVMKQQETLTLAQKERQDLLTLVKTERQLYQQAVKELAGAAKQLTATLKELEGQATEAKLEKEQQLRADSARKPSKKKKSALLRGFAGEKGKLSLPAAGAIVQQFGEHTDKTSGVSMFANGITIETAPGSDIVAVYDGKIVYAGTLRGYGNLIITDHGGNYYSLVSGVGEILRKVGDTVKRHERIGVTSLHTGLLQEGLHFEIRHKTEAQNPLDWLESSQISVKK
jgi:septal ring factor EnvC (AmiA/AmiB activator)